MASWNYDYHANYEHQAGSDVLDPDDMASDVDTWLRFFFERYHGMHLRILVSAAVQMSDPDDPDDQY